LTHEFVTGNHRSLAVTLPMLITPKQCRSLVTFEIAGAYSYRLYADKHFFRAGLGNLPLLYPVIFGAVANDSLHGRGKGFVRFVASHDVLNPFSPIFQPSVNRSRVS